MQLLASQKQILRAAHMLNLSASQAEKLLLPHMITERAVTIQMDNGEERMFPAWRIQHSIRRGPAKGGIRFHYKVSREEVQDLAAWMTMKTALLGLPLGGGKGGVAVHASDLSDNEYGRLARAYIRTFADVVGPDRDIPAPDLGTDERAMAWMADEYSTIRGKPTPGVVTGKPAENGGIEGRTEATGKGVLLVAHHILHARGKDLAGMRVAVQGFGNVGAHAAFFFHEAGAKVIRIGERSCTLEDENGIDVPALIAYKKSHGGSIGDCGFGTACEPSAVLTGETDILIPAALGGVITEENAGSVRAGYIVEGANGPMTPEADEQLRERGVVIIPDILANAGGVVVSFLEWQQNQHPHEHPRNRGEVFEELREYMDIATRNVLDKAEQYHTDLRTAAYIHAISQLI